MAEEPRREFILPEIPEGIDPKLDEYLRQLNETIKDLSMFSASWEGTGLADRGDNAAWDFDEDDLTEDGNWNDLDLSSIVPSGATAVLLGVDITDDAVGSTILLRKNGNSNEVNMGIVRTQIAGVERSADRIVFCDVNQVIEYQATAVVWSSILFTVRGWRFND